MHATSYPAGRKPLPDGFLSRLEEFFGANLQIGHAILEQHGSSESHFQTMLLNAVVFAECTEGVVALVELCASAGVPIVPFGATTSIEGNAAAVFGGISLDLTRMDRIIAVNPEDLDCVVQPEGSSTFPSSVK